MKHALAHSRARRSRRFAWLAAPALVVAGCVGVPQDETKGASSPPGNAPPGGSGNSGSGSPGYDPGNPPGPVSPPPPANATAAVAPLRRLTAEQYRRTVHDLLGVPLDTVAVTALPPDEAVAAKFTSNVVRPVAPSDLDKYAEVAAALTAKVLENPGNLLPCQLASGDEACARKFIETFGRRAYRRPLVPVERERLEKIYAGGAGFRNGVRLVLEAVLQAPKFLYLVEPLPADAAGKIVAVDPYALASRLSYFLWNSMPDDALLTSADKGLLGSAAGVEGEAKRLMSDPRFRESTASFHQAWLELGDLKGAEKDAKLFPSWNAELKAAMAEETRRFVDQVLDGDGKLESLLGASWSVLSGPLYELYGVPRPAGAAATEWRKTDLPAGQRAGLLTQAGLLSALAKEDRTSFVRRGKMVREALFCQDIPPPPPGVNDIDSEIPATASAKERAEAHRRSPECAACHALFDPIGFAFEGYDAIGRYRTADGGKPVESHLDLTRTSIDGSYAGAVELAAKLGGAAEVGACVAKQWLRFALGREDAKADQPSLDDATRRMRDRGGDVRELVFALVASPSFRFQAVE
jgi:hypothetical protein